MINTIVGGIAQDHRGHIKFVNDFDMSQVRRFYIIKNSDTSLLRGWRAHRTEQRWFYVLSGAFSVDLIKIDNWESPSKDLEVDRRMMLHQEMQVLHVPSGYGTLFRALEENSELLVFADFGIEHAASDDHTWAIDYFQKRLPDTIK